MQLAFFDKIRSLFNYFMVTCKSICDFWGRNMHKALEKQQRFLYNRIILKLPDPEASFVVEKRKMEKEKPT